MAHKFDVQITKIIEPATRVIYIDGKPTPIVEKVEIQSAQILRDSLYDELLKIPYSDQFGSTHTLIDGDQNVKLRRTMKDLSLDDIKLLYPNMLTNMSPSAERLYNIYRRWELSHRGHVIDGHPNDKNIVIYGDKIKELREYKFNYYKDGREFVDQKTQFEMVEIKGGTKFYKAMGTYCASLDYETDSINLTHKSTCIDKDIPMVTKTVELEHKTRDDSTRGMSWVGDPATASVYLERYYSGFLELELTPPNGDSVSLFIQNTKNLYRLKKYIKLLINGIESCFISRPDYDLINAFIGAPLPGPMPQKLYSALKQFAIFHNLNLSDIIQKFPSSIKDLIPKYGKDKRIPGSRRSIENNKYVDENGNDVAPILQPPLAIKLFPLEYGKIDEFTPGQDILYTLVKEQINPFVNRILQNRPVRPEIEIYIPGRLTNNAIVKVEMPMALKYVPFVLDTIAPFRFNRDDGDELIVFYNNTYMECRPSNVPAQYEKIYNKYKQVEYDTVHDLIFVTPHIDGKVQYFPSPHYARDRTFFAVPLGVDDPYNRDFDVPKVAPWEVLSKYYEYTDNQRYHLMSFPSDNSKVEPKLQPGQTNMKAIMKSIYNKNFKTYNGKQVTICNDIKLNNPDYIKQLLDVDSLPEDIISQLSVIYYDLQNYGNHSYLNILYDLIVKYYDTPEELCEDYTVDRDKIENCIMDMTKEKYFSKSFYKHSVYNKFDTEGLHIYGVTLTPINGYIGVLKYEKMFNDFLHRRYGIMGILYPRSLRISQDVVYHECIAINSSYLKINLDSKFSFTQWGLDMSKLTRVKGPTYCDADFLVNSLSYARLLNVKFKFQEQYFRGLEGLENIKDLCKNKGENLRIFVYNVHKFEPLNFLYYDGYEDYVIPEDGDVADEPLPSAFTEQKRVLQSRTVLTLLKEKNRKYNKNSKYDINYINKLVDVLLETNADIICLIDADRSRVEMLFKKNKKLAAAYKYKFFAPNNIEDNTNISICVIAKQLPTNVSLFYNKIRVNNKLHHRSFIVIECDCVMITLVNLEFINKASSFARPELVDHFAKQVDQRQKIQKVELDLILNGINKYAVKSNLIRKYSHIIIGDFNFEDFEPQHHYMIDKKFNYIQCDNSCPTDLHYTNTQRMYYQFNNDEKVAAVKGIPLPFNDHNGLLIDISTKCKTHKVKIEKTDPRYKETKFQMHLFNKTLNNSSIFKGRMTYEGDFYDGFSTADITEFTKFYLENVNLEFTEIDHDVNLKNLAFSKNPPIVNYHDGRFQFNDERTGRGYSNFSQPKPLRAVNIIITIIIIMLIIIIFIKIYNIYELQYNKHGLHCNNYDTTDYHHNCSTDI